VVIFEFGIAVMSSAVPMVPGTFALPVDADMEHDEGVLAFYRKNGFIPNAELFNKNRKTISMRKDIYR
jgi:hypothetical protein